MGTIAVAFTGKIKTLNDHYTRLLNGTVPQPSSFDIVNVLSSLIQTLQSVLKEVPSTLLTMVKYEQDDVRLRLLPSMDYVGLYKSLIHLLDVCPLIHNGLEEICISYIHCLGYLMPFLESESLSSLPYYVAMSLSIFPMEMHKEIVDYLIYYVLPFTVTRSNADMCEKVNMPAIIMLVFQYTDNFFYHRMFLESLMALKPFLKKDLLCVAAYGTTSARLAAIRLFLCYWPTFSSALYERKAGFPNDISQYPCQSKTCSHSQTSVASKVCYDLYISIKYTSGNPPPLYLCIECANEIHNQYRNQEFYDILHSVQLESLFCENKNCRSKNANKNIMSLCFSMECAAYNSNHPIHYCEQCHNLRHNSRHGSDHIFHTCLPQAWDMDLPMRTYWMEAIISLMKEARPSTPEIPKDLTDLQSKAAYFNVLMDMNMISTEERQFMGRFGVWLLIGLCKPDKLIPEQVIGRLLSMLFYWFHVTAYCFDEQAECTLEELKSEHICKWLLAINNAHFSVFVSCLLPNPKYYSRVGGHWDMSLPSTLHLKTGINRLLSLIPYDLMTHEVFNLIMPPWLEAISKQVPSKELHQFKMVINKILDPDMNSLGFDAKKLYHFVTSRCKTSIPELQMEALSWIQVLTLLEIAIPFHIIFSTFEDGIENLTNSEIEGEGIEFFSTNSTEQKTSFTQIEAIYDVLPNELKKQFKSNNLTRDELKVCCCVLMLDCILKQMKLHNTNQYLGTHTSMIQDISRLLKKTLSASWFINHACDKEVKECSMCEMIFIWYQFSYMLIEYVVPPPVVHTYDTSELTNDNSKKTPVDSDKKEFKTDSVNSPFMEINTIMTATVETVVEQLDLAPIILTERLIPAVARAATISDQFTISNIKQPAQSMFSAGSVFFEKNIGSNSGEEYFTDSSNKMLPFNSEELPPQLQFLHELLKVLPNAKNSVVLYFMLQSLYLSILQGNFLLKFVKSQQFFLSWCQENLIIKQMWVLCSAEYSHICEICVPILLHCITLPSGSNIFCKVLQEEFHSTDWHVRFLAVERATVIARFVDLLPLQNNSSLQEALTNTFCHLISSIDDSNKVIAQRATLFLSTIHDNAIKILITCLESQFDSVIIDRPVVLQSLYQLYNTLSDRTIFTWEFFLNRFDTLHIESHVHFDSARDIPLFKDLKNTDCTNENFIKKLQRAQGALYHASDSGLSKTLNASFSTKWPYKRTMSAPASISRQNETVNLFQQSINWNSANICNNESDDTNSAPHIQTVTVEEIDRETTHLLIFMLMEFMSKSDEFNSTDYKFFSKTENTVVNHLFLLLGFKQSEQCFQISFDALRSSSIFSAFLSNLPQLLDQNVKISTNMLQPTLNILQYCACPTRNSMYESQMNPSYSLWLLEPHLRRCWLNSLLVICYKYNCKKLPLSNHIVPLIKIILNTLNSQLHLHCILPSLMYTLPRDTAYHTNDNDSSSTDNGECFLIGGKKVEKKGMYEERDASSHKNHRLSDGMPIISNKVSKFVSLENIFETHGIGEENFTATQKLKMPNATDTFSNSSTPLSNFSNSLLQEYKKNHRMLESILDIKQTDKKLPNEKPIVPHTSNDHIFCKPDVQTDELILPAMERLLPVGNSANALLQVCNILGVDAISSELIGSGNETTERSTERMHPKFVFNLNESVNQNTSTKSVQPNTKSESTIISRRRLTKQTALELPGMDDHLINKHKFNESGLYSSMTRSLGCPSYSSWIFLKALQNHETLFSSSESDFQQFCHSSPKLKHSAYRTDENCMYERCSTCGMVKEEYSDDELGLCIIILGAFIHREPSAAAPLLHNILSIIAKLSVQPTYSWQSKSNIRLPGGLVQVARQFLRIILHQLAPSGIFIQMFQMRIKDQSSIQFFRTVIQALVDFKELCPITPLIILLEVMNSKKLLPVEKLNVMLNNISSYIECLLSEGISIGLCSLMVPLETFFRKVVSCIEMNAVDPVIFVNNMNAVLKIPTISSYKGMLEPFSKILSHGLQNIGIRYHHLMNVCCLCYRAFPRDREKFTLTRISIFQLAQALKFKVILPMHSLLSLLHLLLQDIGSTLFITSQNDTAHGGINTNGCIFTGAADVMRQYFADALEFINDNHALAKIKNIYKNPSLALNEDLLGGTLKVAVSQYISLELSHGYTRENRILPRFFPWLHSACSNQQIVRDFNECSNQTRVLSWLLIGSLTNYCSTNSTCVSIPQDVSCYIIDNVRIILSDFPEPGKVPIAPASSLLNCFILCQLWSIYLEHGAIVHKPNTEPHMLSTSIVFDFWSRVTPYMLSLASRSKIMTDTVSLYLVNILEMLVECHSPALSKLLPLWSPITTSRYMQVPGHVQMRLQNCHMLISSTCLSASNSNVRNALLKWLHRIQFKLSQIELQDFQSSHFYTM